MSVWLDLLVGVSLWENNVVSAETICLLLWYWCPLKIPTETNLHSHVGIIWNDKLLKLILKQQWIPIRQMCIVEGTGCGTVMYDMLEIIYNITNLFWMKT